MLESLLSSVNASSTLTLATVATVTIASIVLGLIISLVYLKTNKNGNNHGFIITLIMLPLVISIIIMLVGNNVARAFSLAGAFSIIRFRSAPGDPKDISYVLFTLAIGLACGMGYVGYGAIFTAVLSLLMLVIYFTNFGISKTKNMQLKIVVPEDLNYEDAFDEVLNKYTANWKIENIKTKDFGALYELTYKLDMKSGSNKKEFIDELRCRNGNLKINLALDNFDERKYY